VVLRNEANDERRTIRVLAAELRDRHFPTGISIPARSAEYDDLLDPCGEAEVARALEESIG